MEARFDGNSELVAELVTLNGFKSAYAIKDGAEGPRGWVVSIFLFLFFVFHIYHNPKFFDVRQYTRSHCLELCRIAIFLGLNRRKH